MKNGFGADNAALPAADSSLSSLETTQDGQGRRYGVKFDPALQEYVHLIG